MVDRGITNFTGKATVAAAWRSLVSTQDVVGIKVFSAAGRNQRHAARPSSRRWFTDCSTPACRRITSSSGTSTRTICAPPDFSNLAAQLGVRAAGAWKPATTRPIFTCPTAPSSATSSGAIWNSEKKAKASAENPLSPNSSAGDITKIISIAPLLNQDAAGVCGHLYSLALGSVDNTVRFEGDPGRLAVAVPEIYALPVARRPRGAQHHRRAHRPVRRRRERTAAILDGARTSFGSAATPSRWTRWPSRNWTANAGRLTRRNSSRIWKFTPTPSCSSSA